jgi:glutathione S-transferase
MIDLYTWTTPNGRKISVMLEEVGLPYEVIRVNLGKEENFKSEFTAINPNQKIPAIVDHDVPGGPLAIFESARSSSTSGRRRGDSCRRTSAAGRTCSSGSCTR